MLCNHLVDLVKEHEKIAGNMDQLEYQNALETGQLFKNRRFIGIFDKKFSPEELIRNVYEEQQELCIGMFGPNVPELSLVVKSNLKSVHNSSSSVNRRMASKNIQSKPKSPTFNYIPHALEYILKEVIKNALSAQIKSAIKKHGEYHAITHEPVKILIVLNDQDFIIRISDKGNGVPYDQVDTIWNYHITTANEGQDDSSFFDLAGQGHGAGTDKALSGYGCGLPISKVYAKLMGGNISMETIQGYGTEVFIRLPYLSSSEGSARNFRNANNDAMKFYRKVKF